MTGRPSPYVELQVTTHFSFLRGASSPDELFAVAAALGLPALGIVDRHSVAGLVRAHLAARATGVRLVAGTRVDLDDGTALLLYPTDRAAWGRLCRLLGIGKARAGKGGCRLGWDDVAAWNAGLIGLLLPDAADDATAVALGQLGAIFADRAYLGLGVRRRPGDARRLAALSAQAAAAGVSTVATGDVLYHAAGRRRLQDVLTAIRCGATVDALGDRRERFADRELRPGAEMERLFAYYLGDTGPVFRTAELAGRCRFGLDMLRYQYPDETADGRTPQEELERLTHALAPQRYRQGLDDRVRAQLGHELRLIAELGYAPYFLTVHAIVAEARRRGILCQGRGSAANSAVCYVLGITSIDPVRSDLLFERFISAERNEPPDIDVDFEHERREEIIQWIHATYGRERSALTAVVIRYRTRGALRETGKALGLGEDQTAALLQPFRDWRDSGFAASALLRCIPAAADRRVRYAVELARELLGTPRHLSQHPGGFVLTRDRLDELVPIEPAAMADRQVIEWDKDDIAALGFMKVDVLALGMLSCMRRAFDLLAEARGVRLDLATIPAEDPETYAMIRRADTLGVFQIESRAQMASLPLMAPRTFYDLVIQVAIVRPGPIQGDMVHPYRRRRNGQEEVTFPTPELRQVLEKTLGVPLFQEQAMRVAIVCAGFTPAEADQLRRAMATFKHSGSVAWFRDKLVDGMVRRGYAPDFAERTFRQIEGFGSYGFPESHAASFALIAYASSWMKCHHPDVFCAALLNAQPMGFYAPAQIVRDARRHGVEVRPVDVNHSRWDCTLEEGSGEEESGEEGAAPRLAVRLGLRLVRGLANADAAAIVAARGSLPYATVAEVGRRAGVGRGALERIAAADGFGSLLPGRRPALWAVRAVEGPPLPLFAAADAREGRPRPLATEPEVPLPPMPAGAEVVADYRAAGLSLRGHPLAFLRARLQARGLVPCADLRFARDGEQVRLAGLVLVRQRPGTARGVTFITIEDETEVANLVVWADMAVRCRATISAALLGVAGRVQREGEVIHVVARRLADLSPLLAAIGGDPPAAGPHLRVAGRDFR